MCFDPDNHFLHKLKFSSANWSIRHCVDIEMLASQFAIILIIQPDKDDKQQLDVDDISSKK